MPLQALSLLVSNRFGVLMRITTIFSRRTVNIKSLTVAETENPDISRITVVYEADDWSAHLITTLMLKQEDVVDAASSTLPQVVSRELLLIKMRRTPALESHLQTLGDAYSYRMLEEHDDTVIVEMTGDSQALESFIAQMHTFEPIELCRTGAAALSANSGTIYGSSTH